MPITWRDKMKVDDGIIDQDHKHLTEIINRFEEISADGLTQAEALEILFALKFYAATHFTREEQLQRIANYPYHEAHKKEHEELLGQLDSYSSSFCALLNP